MSDSDSAQGVKNQIFLVPNLIFECRAGNVRSVERVSIDWMNCELACFYSNRACEESLGELLLSSNGQGHSVWGNSNTGSKFIILNTLQAVLLSCYLTFPSP